MPANLVFRQKIWGARDKGIPPRSTPVDGLYLKGSQKEIMGEPDGKAWRNQFAQTDIVYGIQYSRSKEKLRRIFFFFFFFLFHLGTQGLRTT